MAACPTRQQLSAACSTQRPVCFRRCGTHSAGQRIHNWQHSRRLQRGDVQVAQAFFGVGAPEAVLCGVVALVVFGPKGLVEATRAVLGTVRSFQPTIRELQEVTTDLRTNITKEMGLDELQREFDDIRQTTREAVSLNPPQVSTAYPDSGIPTSSRDSKSGSGEGAASSTYPDLSGRGAGSAASNGFSESEGRSLSQVSDSLSRMDEAQESRHSDRRQRARRSGDGADQGGGYRPSRGGLQYGDLTFDDGDLAAGDSSSSGFDAEDLDDMRAKSAAMAWGDNGSGRNAAREFDVSDADRDAALRQARDGSGPKKKLEEMTIAELEAELATRRLLVRKIRKSERDDSEPAAYQG